MTDDDELVLYQWGDPIDPEPEPAPEPEAGMQWVTTCGDERVVFQWLPAQSRALFRAGQ